jgi:RHS repeat-associated protein
VVSYTYDTWGKLISTTGSLAGTIGVKNPYRYRGYRYDIETGLYYLQSRYYNPDWGRFINADGITGVEGELLTHNMFAYCVNNPVNMQDLSGFLHQYASYSSIIISTIAGMIKVGLVSILSASILPYIAIGVIVVGGVSYYNNKQTLAVQREATRIKATIKPNSKNRYWGANLSWKGVTLGKPLTLDQAISEVKAGRNVFAVTKSEARIVAQAASTHPVCDPEIDKGKEIVTGYYYHFHTNVKNGAHVWYLFNY